MAISEQDGGSQEENNDRKQTSLPEGLSLKQKIIFFFKDKYNQVFLGILVLAFLIGLKYINQESIWNDSAVHLWFAVKVVREPLFFFSQEYLTGDYTIPQTFMAFFYLLTKNIFLAGKIVAMLYALAGVFFIYLLGKELRSPLAGLTAAALLAFNHIAWFYRVRPLADSPMLVTTVILLYCLARLERTKELKWGLLTGLMFLVAIFTKAQSVLFIFAFLVYCLIFKRKEMVQEKAVLVSWMVPTVSLVLAHFLGKFLFKAQILDRILALVIAQRGLPFGLEAWGMLQWILSWYFLPFVLLGMVLVFVYRARQYYFSVVFLVSYWLFFEVNVDNTLDRYMLPLLAPAILLGVFSLEEISAYASHFTFKKIKYFIVIAVVAAICWNFYTVGDNLIKNKTYSFTGYQEAGRWLVENVPEEVPIFAGSPRTMRATILREFAGPDEWSQGGSLWYLRAERYLNNRTAFEQDLAELADRSDVYVEIDTWEYTQPRWYYPLSQEGLNYFASRGFQPVKVVEREVPTEKGLQKMPVIFILKREKGSWEEK